MKYCTLRWHLGIQWVLSCLAITAKFDSQPGQHMPRIFLGGWRLTHWGRVTHICVSKLTTIGSDNGLSAGRRQAIIWTNAGTLLIGTLGTSFSEIIIDIYTFSFKKILLNMSSGKWRPFCLGLNVLMHIAFIVNVGDLTVMSYEYHGGVSNHRQHISLLTNLPRLTTKKLSKVRIAGALWG